VVSLGKGNGVAKNLGSTDSRRNGPAAFADAAQRSIADIEARTMNESEIAGAI
jgi:hypothetical protein